MRSRAGLTLISFKLPVFCCCSAVHASSQQTYSTKHFRENLFPVLLALRILAITPHIRFLPSYHCEVAVLPLTSLPPSKQLTCFSNGQFEQHSLGADPRLSEHVSYTFPARGAYRLQPASSHWSLPCRRDELQSRSLPIDH